MYSNATYFDMYGSNVVLGGLLFIVWVGLVSYFYIKSNIEPIKNDWVNQRCKAHIIPFAGMINTPPDKTATDFTKENFDYCIQNILKSSTGAAVAPLTIIVNMLSSLVAAIFNAINAIRGMMSKVRANLQKVAQDIMGRVMNMMIPLQQIIISMRDMMAKIQGTMTAGLFTLFGTYFTLKSLMGAIAEMIVIILIALAALTAGLWAIPFTWGFAAANTVIFIILAVPMAIILAFMKIVLNVESSLSIPGIKCFSGETMIEMSDGTVREIRNIRAGDVLAPTIVSDEPNTVTSTMKLSSTHCDMFELNGVIVSGTHIVYRGSEQIAVKSHPDATQLSGKYEPAVIYCMNTAHKIIIANNTRFTDWDELTPSETQQLKSVIMRETIRKSSKSGKSDKSRHCPSIHEFFDGGFDGATRVKMVRGGTKAISDIEPGDMLDDFIIAYGIVEVSLDNLVHPLMRSTLSVLSSDGMQCTGNIRRVDTDGTDDTDGNANTVDGDSKLDIHPDDAVQVVRPNNSTVFHLLTDSGRFFINNSCVHDYNAMIELYLENYKRTKKTKKKILSLNYV